MNRTATIILVLQILITSYSLSGCSDPEENKVNETREYSEQDWKVFNSCKAKVYRSVDNIYDFLACSEMLKHKKSLRKHGASNSYNYWLNRLYQN